MTTTTPVVESTVTDRERFCAVLAAGPLLKADAIVVLCGEDTDPRVAVAVQLLKTGGAPFIVLSGGRHEPPRIQGAEQIRPTVYGMGVAPDRVLIEPTSTNTHEQAGNVVEMAQAEHWHRLLLVASPYHVPRAFLTFLNALQDAACEDRIRLVPVPTAQAPWFAAPKHMTETRLDLLATEYAKIDAYKPHVASYADGLAYLQWWEGK